MQVKPLSRSQDRPAPQKSALRSSTSTSTANTGSRGVLSVRIIDKWLQKDKDLAASTFENEDWEVMAAALIEAEIAKANYDATHSLTQSWRDNHEDNDPFIGTITAHIARGMEYETTVKSFANKAIVEYFTNRSSSTLAIARITAATQEFRTHTEEYTRDLRERMAPAPQNPIEPEEGCIARWIKNHLQRWARRARGQES